MQSLAYEIARDLMSYGRDSKSYVRDRYTVAMPYEWDLKSSVWDEYIGYEMLQIHITTSIHKLCILYQCLFCWGGGCYKSMLQPQYTNCVSCISAFFVGGGGGGGAVTNPCYNLNTQTVYLVSVPFLLGGGGCYKSMLQPQYTNCVSCISAFFVGGGGGLLQIHVTTSIHKLCILYQCPFGGPKLVHICAFEWYTKTTSAGTLTHWVSMKFIPVNNIPALVIRLWLGAEQAASHYLNHW